ncbi:MAG: 50S ribosomal protein L16 [Candidatus Levybacteria bacterium GW2011_GWA2_37_36]|nr:MAG: 50S ribosomal protein L16 [Candidatus Levybacteria bacterium GW2011_GWA2_37_36]
MLVPKRAKYRKQQKGRIRGKAHTGVKVSFGEFGLLTEDRGLITSRQIEAARRAITHYTPVKPGRMLFEMGGVAKDVAFSALRLASYKLNVKTRIVVKSEYNI